MSHGKASEHSSPRANIGCGDSGPIGSQQFLRQDQVSQPAGLKTAVSQFGRRASESRHNRLAKQRNEHRRIKAAMWLSVLPKRASEMKAFGIHTRRAALAQMNILPPWSTNV